MTAQSRSRRRLSPELVGGVNPSGPGHIEEALVSSGDEFNTGLRSEVQAQAELDHSANDEGSLNVFCDAPRRQTQGRVNGFASQK